MNKEKFLEKLEKKLNVLEESEKKDIIEEYRNTIDEKVKNGEPEEQAVADFGSVNELAKEILKAYKVNVEETESFDQSIKKGATWLSGKANQFFNDIKQENGEITAEKVFEIVIKIFIVLVVLNVLRLPIDIISSLGQSVFTNSIFPFTLLKYLWMFVVEISYLVIVVLFIFYIFKENFFGSKKVPKKATVKKTKPQKGAKATKKEPQIIEKGSNDGLMTAIKIIVIIVVVIPLAMFSFSLISGLSVGLYFIFKGVFFYGPVLLIIGALIFVFHLINSLFAVIDKRNVSSWPILVAFIIILTGLLLTVDWVLSLNITKGEEGKLVEETFIIERKEFNRNHGFWDYQLRVNPDVKEDEIMVIIHYNEKYKDFVQIEKTGFTVISLNSLNKFRQYSNQFIEDLKNDQLTIPYYQIEIHANEKTINYLKAKNY